MGALFFGEFLIKKPSSLVNVIKKIGEKHIEIVGDEYEIFNIFNITDSKISPIEIIKIILENRKQIRTIISYLKNNLNNIDVPRLIEYIEYRKKNPFNSTNEVVLKLMYGNEKGYEIFKKKQINFSKYYTVEYYMSLGLDYDESLKKIQEFKNKKATRLENFIKKHGENVGTKKYNEYINKSKNTIDTFKKRYENEWEQKWSNYIMKDSSSYKSMLKKTNGDVEKAKIMFNNRLKRTTITLKFLIEKYGETDGIKKWNEINLLKDASSLNFFIKKYGNTELAREKYLENNKRKDSNSLGFFNKKYGDDGYIKYVEKCKKSDCNSIDYYNNKYGDELGYKKYIEGQINRKVKSSKASKSSLFYLKPLYDYLISDGLVNSNDIYLGIENSTEFFINDGDTIFFYDFTIPSKNIIIEYNGKAWHPNWEKYGFNECLKYFKNKNIQPELAIEKDIKKNNLAKQKGFDVLVLWEEDSVGTNKNKIYNFLKEKGINYES